MRVLLSTIGSRGDVQPLVALALQLRALGDEARLCVPPDFREWIEGLGLPVIPIGPDVRKAAATLPTTPGAISPEQAQRMREATVAAQFETITETARGCDLIVGATALQLAARSVAEAQGIPYVFAAYCPTVLPSPHHPPIALRVLGDSLTPATTDNAELWAQDARRWNDTWGALLDGHRAALGLPPVDDVRAHIFTDRPWLAADPTLGPWPDPADEHVFQPGAWILPDDRPLSPALEAFLDAGDPPVYFGFGSMRAPQELAGVMVQAARALGRRAIVLRGWADLALDDAPDCLAIGETNLRALLGRVAAAVHHGGAGTTTTAAAGGAPQVVVPQMYDQHYWARRVEALGVGAAHAPDTPTTDSLIAALERALRPDTAARARIVAATVRTDGTRVAAERLTSGASLGALR
jgi:vancomycin aglycone glucosyltransferase